MYLLIVCSFIQFLALVDVNSFRYPMGYPEREACNKHGYCMGRVSELWQNCTKDIVKILTNRKSYVTNRKSYGDCERDHIELDIKQSTLDAERSYFIFDCLTRDSLSTRGEVPTCPEERVSRPRTPRQATHDNNYFRKKAPGFPLDFLGFGYPNSCIMLDIKIAECRSEYKNTGKQCRIKKFCDLCFKKTEIHKRLADLQFDRWIHDYSGCRYFHQDRDGDKID